MEAFPEDKQEKIGKVERGPIWMIFRGWDSGARVYQGGGLAPGEVVLWYDWMQSMSFPLALGCHRGARPSEWISL